MIIFEFKNINIFFIYFNSIFDNDFIKYFKFFKRSKRFESGVSRLWSNNNPPRQMSRRVEYYSTGC